MKYTLAAAALALTTASAAHAEEIAGTLRKIRDSGTILIGYRENSIPFSFLDASQQPIGYSMDLCAAIIEGVKKELGLATLAVKLIAVSSQTRVPLVVNGTIDLECGSTSNTLSRQKQVAFAPTTFISGTKLLAKRSARVKSYRDLAGKTVAVTQGTTHDRSLKAFTDREGVNARFLVVKDHDEALVAVQSGRAAAMVLDDILLYGLIARAKNPRDFEVVGDFLSYEPFGIVFRANDDAFGVVVRRSLARLFGDAGQCNGPFRAIYRKWFVDRIPAGQALGIPMSPLLEAVCRTNALPE